MCVCLCLRLHLLAHALVYALALVFALPLPSDSQSETVWPGLAFSIFFLHLISSADLIFYALVCTMYLTFINYFCVKLPDQSP